MQLENKKKKRKKSFGKHQYDKKHETALLHLTLSLMSNFREHMIFIFVPRKHWMWFFFFFRKLYEIDKF